MTLRPSRPSSLLSLREQHVRGYATTADEVWDHNPICAADGHEWPCDTAQALDHLDRFEDAVVASLVELDADTNHLIQPFVGTFRRDVLDATGHDVADNVVERDGRSTCPRLDGEVVTRVAYLAYVAERSAKVIEITSAAMSSVRERIDAGRLAHRRED